MPVVVVVVVVGAAAAAVAVVVVVVVVVVELHSITFSYQTWYLIPWSRDLLKKLTLSYILRCPKFQSSPPPVPILSLTKTVHVLPNLFILKSILILSSHLHPGLPIGPFPSELTTHTLYAFLSSPK